MSFLDRHRCVPIRTDGKMRITRRTHSFTHAGFEDITHEFDETECPLCHLKFGIGKGVEVDRKIVPYGGVIEGSGRSMDESSRKEVMLQPK